MTKSQRKQQRLDRHELNRFGHAVNRLALGIPEAAKVTVNHIVALCPTCGAKNVKLAHVMGHINKGSKHPITKEHRKWLSEHMKQVQADREANRARTLATAVNTEKK